MRRWAKWLNEKTDGEREELLAIASAFVDTFIIILLLAVIWTHSCEICFMTGMGYKECKGTPEILNEGLPPEMKRKFAKEDASLFNESMFNETIINETNITEEVK